MTPTDPPPEPGRPLNSRLFVVLLLLGLLAVALLPLWYGSGGRAERMRNALAEARTECRARYAEALTAADSARVDSLIPTTRGERRPEDGTCGQYREKRLLR
jgi:type II secretory pathway pseudopilin PulG